MSVEKSKINEVWKGANSDDITIEAYGLIYTEAKERHEETMTESESITTKSITLVFGTLALAGYIFTSLAKLLISPYITIPLFIFFVIIILKFLKLLSPKKVYPRGTQPTNAIPRNLHIAEDFREQPTQDPAYQQKLLYYMSIVRLQDDIEKMKALNGSRAEDYKLALYLLAVLVLAISLILLLSRYLPTYYHP